MDTGPYFGCCDCGWQCCTHTAKQYSNTHTRTHTLPYTSPLLPPFPTFMAHCLSVESHCLLSHNDKGKALHSRRSPRDAAGRFVVVFWFVVYRCCFVAILPDNFQQTVFYWFARSLMCHALHARNYTHRCTSLEQRNNMLMCL